MEFLRVSGGMFLDMTIHDFDMARFQVGEVEEVYAIGGVLVEPELDEFGDIDTDVVTLKFANGAVGVIDNSRKAVYGYDQRLEVFCSNGTAMAENEAETTAVNGQSRTVSSPPSRPTSSCSAMPPATWKKCANSSNVSATTSRPRPPGRMAVPRWCSGMPPGSPCVRTGR